MLQASIGSCPQDLHVSGLRAPRLPDQQPKLAHRPSHPRCAYAHISMGSSNRSAPSSNWGCRSAPARSHPVMLLCRRAACSVRLVSPFSLGSRCYCYSLSRLYRSPDDARKQHIRREFRGRILVRAGTLGPELECECRETEIYVTLYIGVPRACRGGCGAEAAPWRAGRPAGSALGPSG